MNPYAGLQIVLLNLAFSLSVEVIMWAWAYRHPSFRSLKDMLEKQTRKLDLLKSGPNSTAKSKSKKVERLENHLKNTVTKELQMVRLKQMFVVGLCPVSRWEAFILTSYQVVTRWYTGTVVAKLPFEPFTFVQRLTQRGLTDPLITDCSVAFLYALCQTGIRPNLAKLLDFGPSRKMNALQQPMAGAPPELAAAS
eukprot:jgi/Botrbrau1/12472/Bobra.0169s0019.1